MPYKTRSSVIDYQTLNKLLCATHGDDELFPMIVNAPFQQYQLQTTFLFLGIIVLLLVDDKKKSIKRIALSETELAQRTKDVSVMKFEDIAIAADDPVNIIASAIRDDKMYDTTDWKYLFTPTLSAAAARINQANAGIAYSAVYPFKARNGGALIFSYYQYKDQINDVQLDFMEKYTSFVEHVLRQQQES